MPGLGPSISLGSPAESGGRVAGRNNSGREVAGGTAQMRTNFLEQDTKDKLWLQRLECLLFDIERYAHHLESGHELMWENYVSGEPPRHIEIPRLSAGA